MRRWRRDVTGAHISRSPSSSISSSYGDWKLGLFKGYRMQALWLHPASLCSLMLQSRYACAHLLLAPGMLVTKDCWIHAHMAVLSALTSPSMGLLLPPMTASSSASPSLASAHSLGS